MNALLIAEKPSLMHEIRDAYEKHKNEFNFSIDFITQAGHLFTLKLPKEVNAEKYGKWVEADYPTLFPFQYKINNGKSGMLQDIKNALHSGKYDFIIHAGDPDGEGQLLIDETLLILKNTLPVKRFWSNDLTEGAVISALKTMPDNKDFLPIRNAALVRQHEDYQFGMNATAVATLKMHELSPLGRVKAIIIKLLVERELEIENYLEKRVYRPSFTYQGLTFVLDKIFDIDEQILANPPRKMQADIKEVSDTAVKTSPPKLFKLSSLQIYCSNKLKWSASKTLQHLQSLYEKKLTTYPRTDCEYISSRTDVGMIKDALLSQKVFDFDKSLLVRDADAVKKDKNYCNDNAIANEGHTGIIPTGVKMQGAVSDEERILYEIICRRFLAAFADKKTVRKIKVAAQCDNYQDDFYIYTESSDIDPAFELILNPRYEVKKPSGISFTQGQTIMPIEFMAKEYISSPPKRYNDGLLIQALDKPEAFISDDETKTAYKIGTPATRAPIIDACMRNGYFTKKGSVFYASEKAKAIIEMFGHTPLFDITQSGQWEYLFDKIRHGQINPNDVEKYLNEKCISSTNSMKQIEGRAASFASKQPLGKCPHCGQPVVDGKFGPYCTAKCGMSLGKAYGKMLTANQVQSLINGNKIYVKDLISKNGAKYNAYLIPNGISKYSMADGKPGYGFKFRMEYDK